MKKKDDAAYQAGMDAADLPPGIAPR